MESIQSSSDEELFNLLGRELGARISSRRGTPEFVAEIKDLPVGLRAMAATYELDASLVLDDLGWHFGNWHDLELAEETAGGLEVLGAVELAKIFREALSLATAYWIELGDENWPEWYGGSKLEKSLAPLNERAWEIVSKEKIGIFSYWITYARQNPATLT